MRRIVLVFALALVVCLCGTALAQPAPVSIPEVIQKLPNLNQAFIYSQDGKGFDYATTVTLMEIKYKDLSFDLDIGYTKQEVITLISTKLITVKDYLDFPILEWIEFEPFVYIGMDRLGITNGNNEFDWGFGCKILAIKF